MSASTSNIVCDSSTLTNFKAWAQAISSFIGGTAGWSQSSDTGQVNWSTISSVPGNGAYVYEIWEPNDGLTNFYLKIEYGNLSGSTNNPTLRLSIGTSTNGAGTLTGTAVIGPVTTVQNNFTPPSTTVQYPCYFSGAPGRLSILMWRAGGNYCAQMFAVERSLNSSGTYTSTHVTLALSGSVAGGTGRQPYGQQTLMFGVGAAPAASLQNANSTYSGMPVRLFQSYQNGNGAFNSSIGFDTIAPYVGLWDYPLTCIGCAPTANVSEGQIFTATLYGSTRTYVATVAADLCRSGPAQGAVIAFCMRYD